MNNVRGLTHLDSACMAPRMLFPFEKASHCRKRSHACYHTSRTMMIYMHHNKTAHQFQKFNALQNERKCFRSDQLCCLRPHAPTQASRHYKSQAMHKHARCGSSDLLPSHMEVHLHNMCKTPQFVGKLLV